MSLDLKDLQDIKVICESGSFRQAAREMGVTQPTLSNRVAQMERRLGAVLFDRSRGRSRPTALALMVAGRAQNLLLDAGNLVKEVQRLSNRSGGTVRLGFGPAPAVALLPQLILRVKAELPRVSMVCRTGSSAKLLEQLEDGETDIVICPHDAELMRPGFHSEPLIQDRIVAVVSANHRLAETGVSSVADLFSHPVAMPVLEPFYQKLSSDRFGIDLQQQTGVIYCSQIDILLRLAMSGEYAVMGPSYAFRDAVQRSDLMMLEFPGGLPHEVSLFSNARSLPLPVVERVLELLRGHVDEMLSPPLG